LIVDSSGIIADVDFCSFVRSSKKIEGGAQ